jgi:hypothetical protein
VEHWRDLAFIPCKCKYYKGGMSEMLKLHSLILIGGGNTYTMNKAVTSDSIFRIRSSLPQTTISDSFHYMHFNICDDEERKKKNDSLTD